MKQRVRVGAVLWVAALTSFPAAWAGEAVTASGTLEAVETGDYVHCLVRTGPDTVLDLWPKTDDVAAACERLQGKPVRVEYLKTKQHVPEAGGEIEVLSLTRITAAAANDPDRSADAGARADLQKTAIKDEKEKALLLGEHRLTLQWIGWDKPGKATVTDEEGTLFIRGEQRDAKGNFVRVDGRVVEVSSRAFVVEGTVDVQVDYLNGGKNCPHAGRLTFKRTGKRKYWRMQEMQSPCDTHVDYVDVYLAAPER